MLYNLYLLQGIELAFPLIAIPILLVENKFSYQQIGIFSFAATFFTLKIMWAPFLDIFFIPKIGKRKTYIIPIHYLNGIVYLIFS